MNENQSDSRFAKEVILNALNNAFPKALSSYHHIIAREVLRLTGLLKSQYKLEFKELTTIKEHAESFADVSIVNSENANLKVLYDHLKSNKQLKKYYFVAFISCVMSSPSQDKNQYDQYKAIILFVCAKLYMMGFHESAIKGVCNELRQWALGKRNSLSNNLPDIINSEIERLLQELDDARKTNLEVSFTEQIGHQLSRIFIPIRDSQENKEGITRNVKPQFGRRKTVIIGKKIEDDTNESTIIELSEITKTKEQWAREESGTQKTKNAYLVSMKKPLMNGYAIQKLQAKAKVNQALKNQMSLPCDINNASNFEIETLLKFCLNNDQTNDLARSFILASLMLGNSFEQLSLWHFNTKENTLIRQHLLPTQKYRQTIKPLVQHIQKSYSITLPAIINSAVLTKYGQQVENDIADALSALNKKHGTHLTKRKIAKFLGQKLKQEAIDPTIIALIMGESANTHPELSYTQLTGNQLSQTHQRYINYLEKLAEQKFRYIHAHQTSDELIGSPLFIKDDVISITIKSIQAKIAAERGIESDKYHNFITYYVQIALAISSGYRPVTGWLGKITDLNLFNKTFWISDKEIQQKTNGRVVVLPDITLSIIEKYIAYLHFFKVKTRRIDIKLSQRYEDALNGKEHLFFYRQGLSTEEVSPKSMSSHFDSIIPLPLNWYRHYARSLLVSKSIDPDLIAAWMGHAEVNSPSFTRFCSYSMADLKRVANCLNQKLIDTNFKAIDYV
jgi:integrase|tara:strand:- start:832 stop:3033 length:2202 start_codon:yes stop_codon:yes gene_type:complete